MVTIYGIFMISSSIQSKFWQNLFKAHRDKHRTLNLYRALWSAELLQVHCNQSQPVLGFGRNLAKIESGSRGGVRIDFSSWKKFHWRHFPFSCLFNVQPGVWKVEVVADVVLKAAFETAAAAKASLHLHLLQPE